MKVMAIVQARMGSKRLPGKVLKPILGVPMLELLLGRLSGAKHLNKIIVATTTDPSDAAIGMLTAKLGVDCEFGSEENVLERYLIAAEKASCGCHRSNNWRLPISRS